MRNNVGVGVFGGFTTWGRAGLAAGVIAAAALVPLGLSAPAAASSSCTPETGFATCLLFGVTGADQTFTVPTGITSLYVKLWGAGGAKTSAASGGGGGYTTGTVAVLPSHVFTVTVGSGSTGNGATYGGGGPGGNEGFADGGSGGGMSALWSDSYRGTPILIAGGGGGGASADPNGGGGGGGASGGFATDPSSGRGGTQVAGGGRGTSSCDYDMNSAAGSSFTGGNGSYGYQTGGGGGGGGFYGGGGGACTDNYGLARISTESGSGGGGSGYIGGTGVTNPLTTAATSAASAGAGDPQIGASIGSGSGPGAGNGAVVIEYGTPASQTITFTGPADTPLASSTVAVSATSTSGLTVTFTSTTPTCTVTGTTVTLVSGGTCHINADQAGNSSFAAATTVGQNFTVIPAAPAPVARTSSDIGTAPQSVTIAGAGTVSLIPPLTVAGEGTYALAARTITFTPVLGFSGDPDPVTYRVTDAYSQHGDNTYQPTVNEPDGPASVDLISSDIGTTPQTATITIPTGGSARLLPPSNPPVFTQTVIGQGTYVLSGSTVTFTPVLGYVGAATAVHLQVFDAYGQFGIVGYTPTVTAPASPAPVAQTSTGVGTALQTATFPLPAGGSVILVNSANTPLTVPPVQPSPAQGAYSLTGNVITFTPAFGYANTATPIYFRVTDAYGHNGFNSYMPTVTAPAGPVAVAQASTGVGTAAQTVTVTIPASGSVTLMVNGEPTLSWTSPGQGTYVVNAGTHVITFTPIPGYVGIATPAQVRIMDAYLQHSDTTYTPTVTPPPAATPDAVTSTGVGTAVQSATITVPATGPLTLINANSVPATTVTVAGQGTYVLNTETRVITFTPVLGYLGVATPVTFRVTDSYAQTATSTYTPTVTRPGGPTAAAVTSTGAGTAVQSATIAIPSGGSWTLTDAGPIAGQGTYALGAGTGVITFTPVFGFAGVATPAHFRITDIYGSPSSSTYTPTVTAPAGPAAGNLTSTGVGLAQQTGTVAVPTGGSAMLVNSGGQPATTVVVTDEGSYTVDSHSGIITFSPAPGFLGAATAVTYRAIDAYGQHADATYRPTVTIPPPPSAPDESSIGRGTTPQSAALVVPAGGSITLLDADGNPVTELLVPGKGTYRLVDVQPASASSQFRTFVAMAAAASGTATVTFTPILGYKGEAPPVAYQITDAYGQTDQAIYTPTVTLPSAPAPPPKTTTGDQNDTQRVTVPIPAGGSITLLDGRGKPVTSVTIAGQGTYTLDPRTGVITFAAVDGFTGTPSPITYRVTDAYGQTASATYGAAVTDTGRGGSLPKTGDPIMLIVLFGAIAIGLGVAARRLGRRRTS
jgi:CshA-type fibril repeat protein